MQKALFKQMATELEHLIILLAMSMRLLMFSKFDSQFHLRLCILLFQFH